MRSVDGNGTKVLAALSLLAVLAGCGGEEYGLSGSLLEVLDVTHERVELQLTDQNLSLRFLRPRGTGEDIVLKVSVITTGLAIEPGAEIDLASPAPAGGQRAKVTRHVFEDPVKELPDLQRGKLLLSADPFTRDTVTGTMSATFVQGHQVGAGRAVYGSFKAAVVQ